MHSPNTAAAWPLPHSLILLLPASPLPSAYTHHSLFPFPLPPFHALHTHAALPLATCLCPCHTLNGDAPLLLAYTMACAQRTKRGGTTHSPYIVAATGTHDGRRRNGDDAWRNVAALPLFAAPDNGAHTVTPNNTHRAYLLHNARGDIRAAASS